MSLPARNFPIDKGSRHCRLNKTPKGRESVSIAFNFIVDAKEPKVLIIAASGAIFSLALLTGNIPCCRTRIPFYVWLDELILFDVMPAKS